MSWLVAELTSAVPLVNAKVAAPPVAPAWKVTRATSWSPVTGVVVPRAILTAPADPVFSACVPNALVVASMLTKVRRVVG
jgi:hypothetical protein